jgi:MFS family permease
VITVLGDDNLAVAGAVMALMLATSAIAQLAGQRLESPRTQTVGLVVMICGVIALIVAVLDKALAVLLVAAVLAGIGQGFAFMGSLCDVSKSRRRTAKETSSSYYVVDIATAVPTCGTTSPRPWRRRSSRIAVSWSSHPRTTSFVGR